MGLVISEGLLCMVGRLSKSTDHPSIWVEGLGFRVECSWFRA